MHALYFISLNSSKYYVMYIILLCYIFKRSTSFKHIIISGYPTVLLRWSERAEIVYVYRGKINDTDHIVMEV